MRYGGFLLSKVGVVLEVLIVKVEIVVVQRLCESCLLMRSLIVGLEVVSHQREVVCLVGIEIVLLREEVVLVIGVVVEELTAERVLLELVVQVGVSELQIWQ